MLTYLDNFCHPTAALAVEAPPSVAAIVPAPHAIDDPPVVTAAISFCQASLSDFWSSS